MCGISGIVGPGADRGKLMEMVKTQNHRGPDFTGIWEDSGEVSLGHNRLSIVDLSEAANQPFHSDDDRYHLVFNGEIYNYLEIRTVLEDFFVFNTASDTEVLLKAWIHWGESCLDRFNGMFAFAIWDQQEKSLFAARDRFGVKPFYYHHSSDTLSFASEIPALFANGIEKIPNQSVWAGFFAHGTYGLPNETFWQGIHQLPAGHLLHWKDGVLNLKQWYDFVGRVKALVGTSHEDEEKYITELLKDSIKLRFRADVPVGFNLSGGLDSSTLLALVSDAFPHNSEIEAFTFYTADERYDELPWVEEMMKDRPYPLNKCLISAAEIPALTNTISKLQVEPFGGVPTLAYGKVFEAARKKGILVLLDGQGSDEAWAGYDYYFKKGGSLVQGVKSSPVKADALSKDFQSKSGNSAHPQPFDDRLLNLQYRDLFYTKIPRALRFNDRMSMAYSTELREPFLDYRLVEYVFSRPTEFKVKDGIQKWLLRKIAGNYLGDNISLAPKRPLQTPQREWLGTELQVWAGEQIQWLGENTDWFDVEILDKYWKEYIAGDRDNSFYIWQWINAAAILK
ncbi:asparagine synthase (glutamine-hydrolyzing) [Algoriphagus chordae]|uniref:asparagine synthase (glutamine-hydrolyzing) n=1 Tax=Algoriphagus chordae TaxID=237019 RepID=A0A2W7R0T2_9BACT|nr:asparagine synthase (glutamine-hydrolyzing) [Algoriphagus chordae]PZX47679.1 asparagine synthase (glutamine-hydrolysing) [Algoriphagus chordae]